MKIKHLVLAATLGLSLAGVANAQVVSYNPRTGDVSVDSELGYMNDYGRNNRDYFVNDVVNTYGAPRYQVNDLLTTRRWAPGDVYYASALAYQTRRPFGDVVKMYEQDRGQGWGVIAQRMGIKPGSAEFHALKGNVAKSNGRYKAHPGKGNSQGNKAKAGYDDGPGNSGNKAKGASDDGPGNSGNSGKGNGNAGDNGKDKGNSGKGKPNGGEH
jgi:hypothetical protein